MLTGEDKDYTITGLTRHFRPNTPSIGLDVSVIIEDDILVEGIEVIGLMLSEPVIFGLDSSGATLGSHTSTLVIIRDDDRET